MEDNLNNSVKLIILLLKRMLLILPMIKENGSGSHFAALNVLVQLKMTKGMCECADHPSLWALQRFYMVLPNPEGGGGVRVWGEGCVCVNL